MKKKALFAVSIMMILALLVTGCGSKPTQADQPKDEGQEEKLKVAFVYVGPVGDAGWTYSHDLGREYLESKIPNIETTFIESVPEGADSERVITELAEKGNKIIFTTSFGYMDPTINVAKKYPDVTFLHCSGFKTSENVGTYFGRMYQARYLSGIVAGDKTSSNVIGYVAAFPIPEVVRGINAFTLGVRSVNPDAVVKVVWTNTWYDPASEKEAAKGLLDAGADIIAQHQDTPGPQQAAEEKGAFSIGYNTDMSQFAPKAYLTSPIWNWGPYYVETVQSVIGGTWKPEQYWGGMNDGITQLAPMTELVDAETKALVEAKQKEIIDGAWDVFTGEIKDQSGNIAVKAGEKMTDEEMLSFDWFVEGVEGNIPK
ncbi:BMP family ABC transporter substrate-binding protein [Geosporobacter ferrireducens]|uniref:BMP family ABC transporter substrate-binding protein n=1 Tax=Geosporobacter ferrireducens TaxID=1424294 RepID=UPI00139D013F|nr:BMP family ABC transporter substrate-binding protein [Geosporobacter ferrireducens]MTI53681.1 BMP family ABC transporter substrate-binding protein [Geosporobacter ferrireducens]